MAYDEYSDKLQQQCFTINKVHLLKRMSLLTCKFIYQQYNIFWKICIWFVPPSMERFILVGWNKSCKSYWASLSRRTPKWCKFFFLARYNVKLFIQGENNCVLSYIRLIYCTEWRSHLFCAFVTQDNGTNGIYQLAAVNSLTVTMIFFISNFDKSLKHMIHLI